MYTDTHFVVVPPHKDQVYTWTTRIRSTPGLQGPGLHLDYKDQVYTWTTRTRSTPGLQGSGLHLDYKSCAGTLTVFLAYVSSAAPWLLKMATLAFSRSFLSMPSLLGMEPTRMATSRSLKATSSLSVETTSVGGREREREREKSLPELLPTDSCVHSYFKRFGQMSELQWHLKINWGTF